MYAESKVSHIPSQAREFANELRASSKISKNPNVSPEGSMGSSQNVNSADSSAVSDAYAKMLTVFIPLMVDEVKLINIHSLLKLVYL